jgi:hypothetical protein
MKYFAVILSFYILSMAAVPAVVMLHEKFSSCEMQCGAMKLPKEKDCTKNCCYFCCYNPLVLFPHSYKYSTPFLLESVTENNFGHRETFIPLRNSDIWHPPRLT